MKKSFFLLFLMIFSFQFGQAQMWDEELQQTVYGNEWIDFDNADRYYKIKVAEDGVFRIPKNVIPTEATNIEGGQFQLFHLGKEVPVYTSTSGVLGSEDYIEFYGKKNRSELDKHLFNEPENMFNPEYSLFTDTSIYFLTWNEGVENKRYEEIANNLVDLPAAEEWFLEEQKEIFTAVRNKQSRKIGVASLKHSFFDAGEGFGTSDASVQTFNTTAEFPYIGDISAELSVRYATYRAVNHAPVIKINDETVFESTTYYEFGLNTFTHQLNNNILSSPITTSIEGTADTNDKIAVSILSLNYPRLFQFNGESSYSFNIAESTTKKYIEITGFDTSNPPILYDITNEIRLQTTIENDIIKIVLPASNEIRTIILANPNSGIVSLSNLDQITFTDFSDDNSEYIIISHEDYFDDGTGNNPVEAYAEYRRNSPIASYEVTVAEINQLYDQFAYGVVGTPLSIRNFGYFAQANWDEVKYCFLIGKGRYYEDVRLPDYFGDKNLVPTFGSPGSDNLLFGTNTSSVPFIPVGRLTALNTVQITNYLDKVMGLESNVNNAQTIEDRLWMKRAIHLSGGGANDQGIIRNNLDAMVPIFEDGNIGGKVYSYYKESSDVISETSRSEEIAELINTGVRIVNFFGHSSPSAFDFNIQNPEEFTNKDRYFLMISNGCFSGSCHGSTASIGEKFIHAKDKGAFGYYASTGFGYISSLNTFTKGIYQKMGGDFYDQGIGDMFRATVEELSTNDLNYSGNNLLSAQNTLQADPAIRIYFAPGPDFVIDQTSVGHSPQLVNTQLDSLELHFDITNLGQNVEDSIYISIVQELPNGEKGIDYSKKIPAPAFADLMSVKLPISQNNNAVGVNKYLITADSTDLVDELPSPIAEMNNEYFDANNDKGYKILVVSNDIVPIFPTEFAIVNDQSLILKASTSNSLAASQELLFQIDTTMYFDSPSMQEFSVTQGGGVAKWQPEIEYEDNTVYYWRTSPAPNNEGEYRWRNSSFLFLEESESGWNQSHYFQYQRDMLDQLRLEEDRELKYVRDYKNIVMVNGYIQPPNGDFLRPCIFTNSVDSHCAGGFYGSSPRLRINVFDSLTLEAKDNYAVNYYGHNAHFFDFNVATQAGRIAAMDFLQDSIENGEFVAAYTTIRIIGQEYYPEEWAADSDSYGTNLFDLLEEQGAVRVRELETLGSIPYSFYYKKGYPNEAGTEFLVEGESIVEETIFDIVADWDEGSLFSTKIGPASEWNKLLWNAEVIEDDVTYLKVFGIDSAGEKTVIEEELTENELDLSQIELSNYPYLQLEMYSRDSTARSTPQLEYWRVLYQPLPEAALNANHAFSLSADSIQRGQPLNITIGMENIGIIDMDSILIKFDIIDNENNIVSYPQRLKPLLEGETAIASLDIDTRELRDIQSLFIDLNPNNDQAEETHINNTAILNFYVTPDKENPLMDVTFDGEHILNGDIVSPTPNIVITLQDENKFLALADTSLLELFVVSPSGNSNRVYFNNPDVLFLPADASNLGEENKATIEYNAKFEEDGTYSLSLKDVQDVSGNNTTEGDYEIEFEIITKSMISNVLNYPNPFSTATRFVYTLTGNESPTFFKIQIMSVSGRIVREITQAELGELKIGTHQTDFVWDGTDEFGDKLANGVYLYRIVAKNANGEDIEQYETSADRFFNQGFGKMVIVR